MEESAIGLGLSPASTPFFSRFSTKRKSEEVSLQRERERERVKAEPTTTLWALVGPLIYKGPFTLI